MKKKYILLIFLSIVVIIYIKYKNNICTIDNCNNKRVANGKYCNEHTCEWDGCTAQCSAINSMCAYHFEEYINNYQIEDSFTLTASQIEQARKTVDEYCNKLITEHSNILAINIINDTPNLITKASLTYECNVVLENDKINLATIYVLINKDGTFKANKLLYD